MPHPRRSPPRKSGAEPDDAPGKVRTLIGFAVIGFVNTLLPFIISSAAYLIIPYPRPVVLLINTVPALATKLLLPRVLSHIPYGPRPLVFAAVWAVIAFLSAVTAPNVETPVRIATAAIASAAAAAGEVSFLALLRYYGKVALVGWGFGTGSGALACAVLPYVLTYGFGLALRDALTYVYYLVGVMVFTYFAILPGRPAGRPVSLAKEKDIDMESLGHRSSAATPEPSVSVRRGPYINSIAPIVSPYMAPLFLAFAAQAIVYPGISRANATSPGHSSFSSFSAAYGFALHLGNTLARSSILAMRFEQITPLVFRTAIVALVVVANTAFLFTSTPIVVFSLVFAVGILCGAVYINVFAGAMINGPGELNDIEREQRLGFVGAGETAGMLVGGLAGAIIETQLCRMQLGSDQRWCHTVR